MIQHDNSRPEVLSEAATEVKQAFEGLGVGEKLAVLYAVYQQMGESVTPAAPAAADPELAPQLLGDFMQLDKNEQLQVMEEVMVGGDGPYARAYGALRDSNQLLVWYAWATEMGKRVIDMPADQKLLNSIQPVLKQITELEYQEQISLLRELVAGMGHTDVQPIPTQAETGKTASL